MRISSKTQGHVALVFCCLKRGATSETARWLAQNENMAGLLDGPDMDNTKNL